MQSNSLYNFSILQHTNTENFEIVHKSSLKYENEDYPQHIERDDFKQEIEDFSNDQSTEADITGEDKQDLFDLSKKEIYYEVKLSQEEVQKEREKIKISDEYVNAMFKCDLCVTTFTNKEDVVEHVGEKHDNVCIYYY